MNGLPFKSEAI